MTSWTAIPAPGVSTLPGRVADGGAGDPVSVPGRKGLGKPQRQHKTDRDSVSQAGTSTHEGGAGNTAVGPSPAHPRLARPTAGRRWLPDTIRQAGWRGHMISEGPHPLLHREPLAIPCWVQAWKKEVPERLLTLSSNPEQKALGLQNPSTHTEEVLNTQRGRS